MEIEAKFKIGENELDEIISAVVRSGGKWAYHREENNIFFDSSKKKLDVKGEILRIRYERDIYEGKGRYCMTFKGQRTGKKFKIRPEFETYIDSYDDACHILQALGYQRVFSFTKVRLSYELDQCKVEFDELPYIGTFCEIESDDVSRIERVQNKIGLAGRKSIRSGYGSILRAYIKKNVKQRSIRDSKDIAFPFEAGPALFPFRKRDILVSCK